MKRGAGQIVPGEIRGISLGELLVGDTQLLAGQAQTLANPSRLIGKLSVFKFEFSVGGCPRLLFVVPDSFFPTPFSDSFRPSPTRSARLVPTHR